MKSWVLVCILGLPSFLFAQTDSSGDEIGWFARLDDRAANASKLIFLLNDSIFLANPLGLDRRKIEDVVVWGECNSPVVGSTPMQPHTKLRVETFPFTINGREFRMLCKLKLSSAFTLMGLDEIKKLYCPHVHTQCLYMIDDTFLLQDLDWFRIDKDNILKVDTIPSEEIEGLAGKEFEIIRIYTKSKENLKRSHYKTMRLR